MNNPMIYNDKDIDQTILKISSILLSLLCRFSRRKKRKRKSRYRNIGKRIRTLFDGGGRVMYWHVYVIVAICRGRKREKEGGESRGKVDGVWRERERERGCLVRRSRMNAQCITGLRGGRISPSNSTWIPEIPF